MRTPSPQIEKLVGPNAGVWLFSFLNPLFRNKDIHRMYWKQTLDPVGRPKVARIRYSELKKSEREKVKSWERLGLACFWAQAGGLVISFFAARNMFAWLLVLSLANTFFHWVDSRVKFLWVNRETERSE